MDIPLELSFHNLEPRDRRHEPVRGQLTRLEQFHHHIIGCRVVNEMPHRSQKASGNPPDVHIVLRVPGKEIVVSKELAHNGHKKAATDAYAVLDNAFSVAQQQLKAYRRISHGDVKYKSGEPRGAGGPSDLDG